QCTQRNNPRVKMVAYPWVLMTLHPRFLPGLSLQRTVSNIVISSDLKSKVLMKKQFTLRHSVFSVFFLGSLFSASHAFAQQDDGEITIEEDEDEEEVVIEDTQAEENSDKDSASLEDSTSDEAASNEPEASEEPASEEAPAPVQARPSK